MTSTPRRVAVTVYPVMGTPPSDDGAEKVTHTSVFDLRERSVSPGAPGTVATGGVTGADGADAAEVKPAAFVAVTVNVYGVPAVSSVTVIVPEPAWDTVPVPPAGLEVAVYVVIGEPPSDEGAVNVTFADVDPAAATAPDGRCAGNGDRGHRRRRGRRGRGAGAVRRRGRERVRGAVRQARHVAGPRLTRYRARTARNGRRGGHGVGLGGGARGRGGHCHRYLGIAGDHRRDARDIWSDDLNRPGRR